MSYDSHFVVRSTDWAALNILNPILYIVAYGHKQEESLQV